MPEAALRVLMTAALAATHLGLALVAGALASQAWMRRRSSAWARRVAVQAGQARRAGFVLGAVGAGAAAWLEAASMDDASPRSSAPALAALLAQTHYGHAVLVGLLAWLAAAGLLSGRRAAAAADAGPSWAGLAAVAVFIVSRSVVSHAGSRGDVTIEVAVDALHLALGGLWVGVVLAGARLVLPDEPAPAPDRADAARWLALLSTTATAALLGIGASGLFKVWRGWTAVGSSARYLDSAYGEALLAKLALVGVAAALGGLNRFVVLPRLLRSLQAGRGNGDGDAHDDGRWRRRLRRILRIEAATLLLVLVAAAVLSGSEPPDAA